MPRFLLATIGSLGDLHPVLALALELRRRGHDVAIATTEIYRAKVSALGLGFHPLRPAASFVDEALVRHVMDGVAGTARLLRDFVFPAVRDMHADLSRAAAGVDLLVTSELIYAAPILSEQTGVRWISYSLAPLSIFSAYDPRVPPLPFGGEWVRAMPPWLWRPLKQIPRGLTRPWWKPIRELRRELGLLAGGHPLFEGKFSPRLDLALFSPVMGAPQRDWPPQTLQTGFCFFDETETAPALPAAVENFLAAGEPPIVFTLGSAAVYLGADYYRESALAAQQLGRRALLLLGQNLPPADLPASILAWDYLPYAKIFPRAAAIAHQGGIGTTAQALRAGRPMLVTPFAFDQFDNAARLRRLGASRTLHRRRYRADRVAAELGALLRDPGYAARAAELGAQVRGERGTSVACAALERALT